MEVPCRSLEVPCSGNPLIKRIEQINMKSFSPYCIWERRISPGYYRRKALIASSMFGRLFLWISYGG